MTSEYDEIYETFLGLVSGYDLGEISTNEARLLMSEYLMKTISRMKVRKLFESIEIDNDVEEVTYVLRKPLDDAYDKLFVENLLANGMVVGWLSPRMKNETLIDQIFGTKEVHWYSQAAHLNEVRELYKKAETELDKDYVRDRGYSMLVLKGE